MIPFKILLMKAVILAAGRGTRLPEITKEAPKCLIEIGGKTILERQIESLLRNDVEKIYVVVGFMADKIKEKLKSIKEVIIIENKEYETTDNIYSLYLTCSQVKRDDFVLLNGDVIFEKNIIEKVLMHIGLNIAPIDSMHYDLEELKIRDDEVLIREILPKNASKEISDGSTIGIFKFSAEGSEILFDELEELVERSIKNKWFEYALNKILYKIRMYKVDIHGLKWIEVDTMEDIKKAQELFGE